MKENISECTPEAIEPQTQSAETPNYVAEFRREMEATRRAYAAIDGFQFRRDYINAGTLNGLREAARLVREASRLIDKWEVRIVEGRKFVSADYLEALLWQESENIGIAPHAGDYQSGTEYLRGYFRRKEAAKFERRAERRRRSYQKRIAANSPQ